MCLWSMAVYCVEESPNKEGKLRSFNFLQIEANEIAKHLKNNVCIEDSEILNVLIFLIERKQCREKAATSKNHPLIS